MDRNRIGHDGVEAVSIDAILAALAAIEHPRGRGVRASQWSWTTWLALAAVMGCAMFGAWLTAEAVIAGDITAVFLRFGAASLLGAYAYAVARTSAPTRRR